MGSWSFPFLFVAALYTLHPTTISVYPAVAMAPATFRITVLVPRHLENRQICFGVDGPELKRSCVQLDGFNARRSWTVYWELRGSGEYMASAVLTRMTDGREKTFRNEQPFRVLGMEPY